VASPTTNRNDVHVKHLGSVGWNSDVSGGSAGTRSAIDSTTWLSTSAIGNGFIGLPQRRIGTATREGLTAPPLKQIIPRPVTRCKKGGDE